MSRYISVTTKWPWKCHICELFHNFHVSFTPWSLNPLDTFYLLEISFLLFLISLPLPSFILSQLWQDLLISWCALVRNTPHCRSSQTHAIHLTDSTVQWKHSCNQAMILLKNLQWLPSIAYLMYGQKLCWNN